MQWCKYMQIVSKRIKRIPCFLLMKGTLMNFIAFPLLAGFVGQRYNQFIRIINMIVYKNCLYTHAYTLKPTDLFFAGLTVGVPFSGSNFQNMGLHFACRNHLNDLKRLNYIYIYQCCLVWVLSWPFPLGWFGSNLVDSGSPNDKKSTPWCDQEVQSS